MVAEILEVRVQARAAMRAAAYDSRRFGCARSHFYCHRFTVAVTTLCANALAAHVGLALNRDMHDAEYRSMVFDERNIDCEFAVAIDELLGPVQWIDEPVALPLTAYVEVRKAGLFRDNRDIGGQ